MIILSSMGEVSQSRLALLASLILCSSSAGHSTKNVGGDAVRARQRRLEGAREGLPNDPDCCGHLVIEPHQEGARDGPADCEAPHAWLPLYGVKAFAGEEGVDYAMHGPGQHYYGAGRMMRGIAIAAEKYPGLEWIYCVDDDNVADMARVAAFLSSRRSGDPLFLAGRVGPQMVGTAHVHCQRAAERRSPTCCLDGEVCPVGKWVAPFVDTVTSGAGSTWFVVGSGGGGGGGDNDDGGGGGAGDLERRGCPRGGGGDIAVNNGSSSSTHAPAATMIEDSRESRHYVCCPVEGAFNKIRLATRPLCLFWLLIALLR
jgi:hypothetical protein